MQQSFLKLPYTDTTPSASGRSNASIMQSASDIHEPVEIHTAEIESTAYALLSYVSHGDIGGSLPIVRWLSSKRNNLGGFSSTQDTTIALYALSRYAAMTHIKSGGRGLN